MMTPDEHQAMVDGLRAWDAKRTAERERAFAQLRATWDAMLAQAGDADAREAALAWCRQRIDVPPAQSFPHGEVKSPR
jgi:hypothetical protein